MGSIIQKIIRVMPVILLLLLIFVDRENKFYVIGFLSLLFIYTIILIVRILYAKKIWHKEFNDENYEINKLDLNRIYKFIDNVWNSEEN